MRSVLKACVAYRRHEGRNYKTPPMAPIPQARVSQSVPFSRTGFDYLGPLYIKQNKVQKGVGTSIHVFECPCYTFKVSK